MCVSGLEVNKQESEAMWLGKKKKKQIHFIILYGKEIEDSWSLLLQ